MGFLKRLFGGAQEAPRTTSVAATEFGGREDLEVVGESHHQESLRRIVGPTTERVKVPVTAILIPETNNAYDPNAVSVWISGLLVGYLSRDDAVVFRPGLVDLCQRTGTPIALPGVIAGGGAGRPSLGVFLNYDAAAFGLEASEPVAIRRRGPGIEVLVRTGLSEAEARDDEDDDYDLGWESRVPTDRLQAMTFMRAELLAEREPLSRHYMYAQLEGLLYGAREDFTSALIDYDATCEAHNSEMAAIRPALLKTFGGLPLLEMYKQAAIRHQKAHDWQAALRWAELGVAVYGTDALRSEFPDDLGARAMAYRQKLDSPLSRPRSSGTARFLDTPSVETLICRSCGKAFERLRIRGRKPLQCPDCRVDA